MFKWTAVVAISFAAFFLFVGATASPEKQAQQLTEVNLKKLLKDPSSMTIKSSFIVKKPADKNGIGCVLHISATARAWQSPTLEIALRF